MSQNLSSAAVVIGALRVNKISLSNVFLFVVRHALFFVLPRDVHITNGTLYLPSEL